MQTRDEDLRLTWLARVVQSYRASQLVVVDETGTNERGLDRRWGWSPRDTAYRMINTSRNRSQCWSILPAISINSYLEYEIYQGSFNSERFVLFVRKLLKKMNPFPGPRSVWIMDNCSTHHSRIVKDLCREEGVGC